MNFLVDNQLPVALARFLSRCGHESKHVLDVQMDEAKDSEIIAYAVSAGFVIISKDQDFSNLLNQPGPRPQLVWVRLPNCRKEALLAAFEHSLAAIIKALESGSGVVELR